MFDLEKEIREWKKGFAKHGSIEDALLNDLEWHLREAFDVFAGEGIDPREAFRQAVAQVGTAPAVAAEYGKNRELALDRRTPWRPARFMPALWWAGIRVSWRKVRRQKGFAFLNLAGLIIGMAAFLLITIYCRFERSYDGFHGNAGRIYRLENHKISATFHDRNAACPFGLGPALKKEFPEVAGYTRLFRAAGEGINLARPEAEPGDTADPRPVRVYPVERVIYADPSLLQIFSFPLLQGDPASALLPPEAVVLTETTARRIFGQENPLNQAVTLSTAMGSRDCRITGICRDVPPNSHVQFDMLLAMPGLAAAWPSLADEQLWDNHAFQTYILLAPSADPAGIEAKLPGLVQATPLQSDSFTREFHLQPLRDIHLKSRMRHELEVNGDARTVMFLEIISIFILVIAWVNAINLATARSQQRGKEVGVRKTLGAARRQLMGQFLLESAGLNGLAFILAFGLVAAALPFFSQLVDRPLAINQLGPGWIVPSLVTLAGALLSGLYPALILSSFQPAFALRNQARGRTRSTALRKGLVLFQFVLAVVLITATLIVEKQLVFMRTQDLGADIRQTLVLKVPQSPRVKESALVAREQVARLAAVEEATVSMSVPGQKYPASYTGISRQAGKLEGARNIFVFGIDERYLPFFRIPLAGGRNLTGNPGTDREAVLINETASRILGFPDPARAVQQAITVSGSTLRIAGVVRDYHHLSLRDAIEPTLFYPLLGGELSENILGQVSLSLKIKGSADRAIAAVGDQWKSLFPGQPLDYFFLDNEFNRQYDADQRFARVFSLAALLAISVACLGLFGLAAYSAERRFREIGIRKVFGATMGNVAAMLTWEFTRWVLLANLLAWPLAWLAMSRWQSEFACRAPFGIEVFLFSGMVSLTIALFTVGFQAIRAARTKPATSLKFE